MAPRPSDSFNVEVINETGDFYRFFDATPHAEFLYSCVQKTIDVDLPYETDFLRRYDQFRAAVEEMFDMPERTIDLLFRFLHQNDGRLSTRAREKEFAKLKDDETDLVEAAYREFFVDNEGIDVGQAVRPSCQVFRSSLRTSTKNRWIASRCDIFGTVRPANKSTVPTQ